MTIRTQLVRPADALATLGSAVATAKGGSPLTPVTVIVPTNALGVMARRSLGQGSGIAAVNMVTPYRLAELVAGPTLHEQGRNPVSTPILDITIRSVLADEPRSFAEVATHPSTITALRDLHRELRQAGPRALQALASSSERGRGGRQGVGRHDHSLVGRLVRRG